MNTKKMHDVMTEKQAGQLVFPEVIRRLSQAGVESYFVDFAAGAETFDTTTGETHTEAMTLPPHPVAVEFSKDGIVAAIRGAQADTVRYPEFVELATSAGVIAYWAYLTERKVVYFGRKGEMHIETFPS